MALSLQEGGIGIMDWQAWIGRLPAFANEETEEIRDCFKVSEDYLDNLKFNECLPGDIAQSILRDRLLEEEEIAATTARQVITIACE